MNKDKREKENATKYGEFVSSYFGWVSPEKQKDRGRRIRKNHKKRRKK